MKIFFGLIALFFMALAVLFALYFLPRPAAPTLEQDTLAKTYITQNISVLSPEKAVLGGHFYVTSVDAAGGKGVVNYEDGHISLTADFTYEVTGESVVITAFSIRH
jgi:hypothetical protein